MLQAPGQAAPGPRPGRPAARRDAPAYKNADLSTSQRVADLLGRMTLAEKIGQMTQAERIDVDADPSLITTYGLGSVLSGGGSTPASNTPEAWADMVDRYQEAALETRLGIPLLYGVDSVHGHGNLQGATVFPHNIGLGATRDPGLVEKIGHITAIETRASGPQWAFAPCVCVARDDRWGRTYESFGEDPRLVIKHGDRHRRAPGPAAATSTRPDRVLATAKHYAGDGLTTYGTPVEGDYTVDQGIDQVSRAGVRRARARRRTARPINKHHVGSVMPSFSSVDWTEDGLGNPIKMHANQELITDVLKGELGFDGLVISDWRAIRQIPGDYREQVRLSVNAGIDMFMEPIQAPNNPDGWDVFIPTLTSLVEDGEVPMSRIDDAVSRILTAKFELGLFEHPFTDRTQHRHDRQPGAPQGRPARGGRVAGAAQEPAGHPAAEPGQEAAGLRRRQQRRQHRQPGRRLDADLAGRLDQRDPRPDRPRRGAGDVQVPGAVQRDRERPGARPTRPESWWSARRRTPRGSATSTAREWAYDPGDNGVPRPEKTMLLSDADQLAIRTGLLEGRVVHGPGRLRAADDHPAGAGRADRRAGRLVAAGQRGRWASPTCCSGRSRSPASSR